MPTSISIGALQEEVEIEERRGGRMEAKRNGEKKRGRGRTVPRGTCGESRLAAGGYIYQKGADAGHRLV